MTIRQHDNTTTQRHHMWPTEYLSHFFFHPIRGIIGSRNKIVPSAVPSYMSCRFDMMPRPVANDRLWAFPFLQSGSTSAGVRLGRLGTNRTLPHRLCHYGCCLQHSFFAFPSSPSWPPEAAGVAKRLRPGWALPPLGGLERACRDIVSLFFFFPFFAYAFFLFACLFFFFVHKERTIEKQAGGNAAADARDTQEEGRGKG